MLGYMYEYDSEAAVAYLRHLDAFRCLQLGRYIGSSGQSSISKGVNNVQYSGNRPSTDCFLQQNMQGLLRACSICVQQTFYTWRCQTQLLYMCMFI